MILRKEENYFYKVWCQTSLICCKGIWFGAILLCHQLFLIWIHFCRSCKCKILDCLAKNLLHSGLPFKLVGAWWLKGLYMELKCMWAASTDVRNTESLSEMATETGPSAYHLPSSGRTRNIFIKCLSKHDTDHLPHVITYSPFVTKEVYLIPNDSFFFL